MFQKKVLTRTCNWDSSNSAKTGVLALGVVGEFYDDSPHRTHPFVMDKTRKVGTFVPNFGIIVNPKEYALMGGLAPSLDLQKGQMVQTTSFGHIIVAMGVAAAGAGVAYDETTGALSAATGADGEKVIANAKVIIPSATEDGLAVVELNG